jgi:hypothetical protein
MTSFYARQGLPSASLQPAATLLQRKPQRVTATMSWSLHNRLQARADEEGRSLSNLIAHLLETAIS